MILSMASIRGVGRTLKVPPEGATFSWTFFSIHELQKSCFFLCVHNLNLIPILAISSHSAPFDRADSVLALRF